MPHPNDGAHLTLPWHRVPSGRGLYDRGNPNLYDELGGVVSTAKLYGCSWLAVEASSRNRFETGREAHARRMRVWVWTWPSNMRPENWRIGLGMLEEAARELRADGVIVDMEEWDPPGRDGWRQHRGELTRAIAGVEAMARRRPTAFSTFPSFGGEAEMRRSAPSLAWVQPQCYGVRSGNLPADRGPLRWAAEWAARWRQPVIPALAAWNRPPELAIPYLDAWDWRYRAVQYWTTTPWSDPARVDALSSLRTRPSPWMIGGGVALTAATVAAVGYALRR